MIRIDPCFQPYLASLLDHAETALWPERRAALESFAKGIAICDSSQLALAAERLPGDWPEDADPAELIFRAILSVYLEQLGEHEITNPDQAHLYACSLEGAHLDLAEDWLDQNPDYRLMEEQPEV